MGSVMKRLRHLNWTDWFIIGLVVVSFTGLGVIIGIDWSK